MLAQHLLRSAQSQSLSDGHPAIFNSANISGDALRSNILLPQQTQGIAPPEPFHNANLMIQSLPSDVTEQ